MVTVYYPHANEANSYFYVNILAIVVPQRQTIQNCVFTKCSFTFTNLNHHTYFSIHNVAIIVRGSIKFLFSNIKITTIAGDLVPN